MWGGKAPLNCREKFMNNKNVRFLVKAGKGTNRKNYVPMFGEVIATNDEPRLFLGDGVTKGGKPLSIKTHIVDVLNDVQDDEVIVGDFAFTLQTGALYICVSKDEHDSPVMLDLLYRRVDEVYVVHAESDERGINEVVDENLPEYVANDSRYVLTNPFGSRSVLVVPELWINGKWTKVGQGTGGAVNSAMYGVIADDDSGELILQTARDYLFHPDPAVGGLHTATRKGLSPVSMAKCRLRVIEVGEHG